MTLLLQVVHNVFLRGIVFRILRGVATRFLRELLALASSLSVHLMIDVDVDAFASFLIGE